MQAPRGSELAKVSFSICGVGTATQVEGLTVDERTLGAVWKRLRTCGLLRSVAGSAGRRSHPQGKQEPGKTLRGSPGLAQPLGLLERASAPEESPLWESLGR